MPKSPSPSTVYPRCWLGTGSGVAGGGECAKGPSFGSENKKKLVDYTKFTKFISANSQHDVENAIRTIRSIIKDAIENPEGQNDLRKTQLMELARLNGTLREGFEPRENSWLKPENQTVKKYYEII